MVDYWNDAVATFSEDDIDYKVVEDTNNATNKKFGIASIEKTHRSMEVIVGGVQHTGERHFITIHTTGLINIHSFNLTFGAIDEFLSSAIDEYLFENDLSDINPSMLSQRPFYPYCFFNEILSFYGMKRPSAFEKILIAYFALNSSNPPVVLIEILEKLRDGGYEPFQENPETYLLSNFSETLQYNDVLNNIKYFADLTSQQGRIHISQALKYYYDKFYVAQKVKENDFFFFVRPFFVSDENTIKYKQKFLLELSRIINLFTPPLILKDKQFFFIDKLTTFGEATVLILATYEIFESLRTNRIASRPAYQKAKYTFPDRDPDCDNFEKFTPPPINGIAFRLALNELNLYGLYLQELENLKQTNS
ncbi:hypothetical protein [Sphingobacterium multivorum]